MTMDSDLPTEDQNLKTFDAAAIRDGRELARRVYEFVEMRRLAGAKIDAALAAAAAASGVSRDRARQLWRAGGHHKGTAKYVDHIRRVLLLAADGWRHVDIAEKVGMHEKSVGRIIRAAARDGGK